MKQEMMGWHWHQLYYMYMQTIYTSLQTDNHASTSALMSGGVYWHKYTWGAM